MSRVRPRLAETVKERAQQRCEYCHFPDAFAELGFEIEHIIASKHHGKTESGNLAYAFTVIATKGQISQASIRQPAKLFVSSILDLIPGQITLPGMVLSSAV